MGYNFAPTEDHVAALHSAADKLEEKLKELIKEIKGYKGIRLSVRSPNWGKHLASLNPLEDDWYDSYPTFVQECEINLYIAIKNTMLRRSRDVSYAKIKLTKLPACCGVCVMNGMMIHSDIRGKGIGKEFTKVVEAFAKVLNYSYVMCTTHKVNGPANGVLECLDYANVGDFANMRTKNSIIMYGKNINPDGETLTDGYLDVK